jgi:hypothetical protein
VLRNGLLAEAQYSERRFEFKGLGGTATAADLVDSPFLSVSQGRTSAYNAPLGDATDPEQRNNRQVTASLTGDWKRAGRHETKVGYEFFRSQRTSTGTLSSTDNYFLTAYATDSAGRPVLDAGGRLIPVFTPRRSILVFVPGVRGAVMNTDENSLYVQDHWTINNQWSADLGARFEHVNAVSTGGIVSVDNNRIVPRLAAGYDVMGNGDHIIHATYGQYSGRYDENQVGANSPVGHTAEIDMVYVGTPGQGRGFAPGFNRNNYMTVGASDPLANVFMDKNLRSPLVHEFTTSYGTELLKGRGYAEVTYVYRKTTNLIEDFLTIAGGTTHVVVGGVDAGLATNTRYQNTDQAHRQYQGMVFQSRYRFSNRWSVNGHYTLQIKNDGNYEGEGPSNPGATSLIGNYPEAFSASRNFPNGRLQDFQRHRLRVWSIYDVPMGRYGELSVSGLWRVNSGRVYSLIATQPLTATQNALLAAAGYPDMPSSETVYFGDRGSQSFKGYALFDSSINYKIPLFRSLRPWVKFDVYNLLNNKKLVSWDTAVIGDPNSPKDSLGLPTGYTPTGSFGTAISTSNFPAPFGVDENGNAASGGRTFRVAVGFRF